MPLPRFLTMPRPPLARLAPLALFRQTLPSDLDHLVALRITASTFGFLSIQFFCKLLG